MEKATRKIQSSDTQEGADTFENAVRRVNILLDVYPHFRTYFEKRMQDEIQAHVYFNLKRRERYDGNVHKTFHLGYEGVDRMLEFAPIEVSLELERLRKEHSNNLLGIIFTKIAEDSDHYNYKSYSRQTRELLK